MKYTDKQRKLLKSLREEGPIDIPTARVLRAMDSLKLLHRYGLVNNTMYGFSISPKGLRETRGWD